MKMHSGKKIIKARDLPKYVGKLVRFAGLLITDKVVHTQHVEPMEFLTFEDETGQVEITFFADTYHRFCTILDRSHPLYSHG